MEILQQFGIEGKLFAVQLINFLILALVMWRFVMPRITKLLDQRKAGIQESLEQAEAARAEVEAARAEKARIVEEAKAEAAQVIGQAQDTAKAEAERLMAEARQDAAALSARTEQNLIAEREQLRAELRAELAGLTVAATRSVLSDVLGKTERAKILDGALKRVGQELPVARAQSKSARLSRAKRASKSTRS